MSLVIDLLHFDEKLNANIVTTRNGKLAFEFYNGQYVNGKIIGNLDCLDRLSRKVIHAQYLIMPRLDKYVLKLSGAIFNSSPTEPSSRSICISGSFKKIIHELVRVDFASISRARPRAALQ